MGYPRGFLLDRGRGRILGRFRLQRDGRQALPVDTGTGAPFGVKNGDRFRAKQPPVRAALGILDPVGLLL